MSLYNALTSQEERKIHRLKITKQMVNSKEKFIKSNNESQLQKRFNETGIKFINAVKFQSIRIVFILVITVYYVISSIIESNYVDYKIFAIPCVLFIATEPTLKWSLSSLLLNMISNRLNRKKIEEVFTLFDLLKADLDDLQSTQNVNMYNIIKQSLPMFTYIKGSLSRMLSLWKSSPEKAKIVLFEEIGGENTKVIGEIIYKIDQTTKEEALDLIEAESSVFTFSYYQNQVQSGKKQKTVLFSFFTLTSILVIAWLVIFVFAMFNSSIDQTTL